MNPETPPNSVPSLLRELRDETTTLLRQEVALAKTEMKENLSRFGSNVAHIAIGGFIAYAGAIVLLIGLGHLLGALLERAGMSGDLEAAVRTGATHVREGRAVLGTRPSDG